MSEDSFNEAPLELERLSKLSADERFTVWAEYEASSSLEALPDIKVHLRRVKATYAKKRTELRSQICSNNTVKDFCLNERVKSRRTAGLAVVDILLPSVGLIPACVIASQLLEEGFQSLCAEIWKGEQEKAQK